MPIKKKSVYFLGLGGQYCDNVKYISQKLHTKLPEIIIFWSISEKCKGKLPFYIRPVRENSLTALKLRFSSQVVVDCDMGITIPYYLSIFKGIIKRKKQLTISTWHGTPLKKILVDDIASKCRYPSRRRLLSDFIIAGCSFTASTLIKSIQGNYKYPVYLTGTPRNDILFSSNMKYKSFLKEKLTLPQSKRVILFAPTFRDAVELSGTSQMKELNIPLILEQCSERFGGEWVFVLRVHHKVILSINSSVYKAPDIIDGNKGDDMAEYLVCTDILITDYSGSMFDFALTGRPCFLFAPDREHYEREERGFYLDYDSLPFPKAYTNTELLEQISIFDCDLYKKNIEKFLDDIGNVEDGNASERIAKCIVHFMETGEKRLEAVNGVETL